MQKLINVMAVASFAMSAGMAVSGMMLYTRIPSLTKLYISELRLEMTELITDMVPEQVEQVMPELPTETGLPIPLP